MKTINSAAPATAARFWIWLLLVLLCGLWLAYSFSRGIQFDSSITDLLPQDRQSIASTLLQENFVDSADNRVLIIVEETDQNQSITSAEILYRHLLESHIFASVQLSLDTQLESQWQDFYFPSRYRLLAASSRGTLLNDPATLVETSVGKLFSPLASMITPTLAEDPLQLYFQWQLETVPKTRFSVLEGGMSYSDGDKFYRMILLELSESPYSLAYQQKFSQLMIEVRTALPASSQLLMSGLIQHASYGAEQARREISTIGIGSVIGILVLLGFCFRSARLIALTFLPIVVGCGFALAVSLLFYPSIHLITLAFGAGLVGVSIDYALHYLCALRNPESSGQTTLRMLLPGLYLGLISSLMAYGAQAITPFPGLRQMALFCMTGLLGAWLTVVCWYPVLVSAKNTAPGPGLVNAIYKLQLPISNFNSLAAKAALLLVSLALLFFSFTGQPQDDLRLLQTSPQSMLDEEYQVQQLLVAPSVNQYFVLQSGSEQELLRLEENFSDALHAAIASQWISSYQAVSQFVPSEFLQQDNLALISDRVYGAGAAVDVFEARTGIAGLADLAQEKFQQAANPVLTVDAWLNSDISEIASHQWIGEYEGSFYSAILLNGIAGREALSALRTMAENNASVFFVDRVEEITAILSSYRQQLTFWLVMAYLLLGLLLTARYKMAVWRVVAVPALASLITAVLLQLTGVTLTVFHVLALLLVLGIGIDASIFLQESRNNPHTWLAITMSSLTTLLAFGLLALSATPVLHFFGQTVLLGIIAIWLLAPGFVGNRENPGPSSP